MAKTSLFRRIGRIASWVLDSVGLWPGFAGVLVLLVMIFVSIVTRYFGLSLSFVEYYAAHLVALITLFVASYMVKENAHLTIDVITQRLNPRARIFLEVVTRLVALGVLALLFIATMKLVMLNFKTGVTELGLGETPLAPIQLIMPIGFGLFFIQTVIDIVKKVKSLLVRE